MRRGFWNGRFEVFWKVRGYLRYLGFGGRYIWVNWEREEWRAVSGWLGWVTIWMSTRVY